MHIYPYSSTTNMVEFDFALVLAVIQYWPDRKNVCHKKLTLNLLVLNLLWHTPHAVALDKVLSLSPK